VHLQYLRVGTNHLYGFSFILRPTTDIIYYGTEKRRLSAVYRPVRWLHGRTRYGVRTPVRLRLFPLLSFEPTDL